MRYMQEVTIHLTHEFFKRIIYASTGKKSDDINIMMDLCRHVTIYFTD